MRLSVDDTIALEAGCKSAYARCFDDFSVFRIHREGVLVKTSREPGIRRPSTPERVSSEDRGGGGGGHGTKSQQPPAAGGATEREGMSGTTETAAPGTEPAMVDASPAADVDAMASSLKTKEGGEEEEREDCDGDKCVDGLIQAPEMIMRPTSYAMEKRGISLVVLMHWLRFVFGERDVESTATDVIEKFVLPRTVTPHRCAYYSLFADCRVCHQDVWEGKAKYSSRLRQRWKAQNKRKTKQPRTMELFPVFQDGAAGAGATAAEPSPEDKAKKRRVEYSTPAVGPPSYFLAYARGEPFLDTLSALICHVSDTGRELDDTYVWIDVFCLNHHTESWAVVNAKLKRPPALSPVGLVAQTTQHQAPQLRVDEAASALGSQSHHQAGTTTTTTTEASASRSRTDSGSFTTGPDTSSSATTGTTSGSRTPRTGERRGSDSSATTHASHVSFVDKLHQVVSGAEEDTDLAVGPGGVPRTAPRTQNEDVRGGCSSFGEASASNRPLAVTQSSASRASLSWTTDHQSSNSMPQGSTSSYHAARTGAEGGHGDGRARQVGEEKEGGTANADARLTPVLMQLRSLIRFCGETLLVLSEWGSSDARTWARTWVQCEVGESLCSGVKVSMCLPMEQRTPFGTSLLQGFHRAEQEAVKSVRRIEATAADSRAERRELLAWRTRMVQDAPPSVGGGTDVAGVGAGVGVGPGAAKHVGAAPDSSGLDTVLRCFVSGEVLTMALRLILSLEASSLGVTSPVVLTLISQLARSLMGRSHGPSHHGEGERRKIQGLHDDDLAEPPPRPSHRKDSAVDTPPRKGQTPFPSSPTAVSSQRVSRLDTGEQLLRKAALATRRTLGALNEHTIEAQGQLVDFLCFRNRHMEAEPLARKALVACEKSLGPRHRTTWVSMHRLARVLKVQYKFAEAEVLLRRARQSIGEGKSEHLDDYWELTNDLALVLVKTGKANEAARILRDVSELCEDAYGANHTHSVHARFRLGVVLAESHLVHSKLDVAAVPDYDIIPPPQRASGQGPREAPAPGSLATESHDSRASTTGRLSTATDSDTLEEAEEHLTFVYLAWNKSLGGKHVDTLDALKRLALLKRHRCQWVKAAALFRRLYRSLRQRYGDEDTLTLTAMVNLANTLTRGNSEFISEPEDLDGDEDDDDEDEEDDDGEGGARIAYSTMLSSKAPVVEAERLYRRVYAVYQTRHSGPRRETADCMHALARILVHKGEVLEAEALLRQVMACNAVLLGYMHGATVSCVVDLGELLEKSQRLKEAETLYGMVIERLENTPGPWHPDTFNAVNNLAVLLCKQDRTAEAEVLYRNALTGLHGALGRQHPDTVNAVWNLGLVLYKLGRFAEGEELVREALGSFEKRLGNRSDDAREAVCTLVELLRKAGKVNEVREFFLQRPEYRRLRPKWLLQLQLGGEAAKAEGGGGGQ